MRIPEETIETVRSKTDIVDLIGEYIQLTKRGKNWFGLCPFHGESTPSFSVSEEKQLFHCFGCGASGNAITFVMDIENHTFVEAVSRLAERIGLQVDIAQPVDRHMKAKNVEHQKMIEAHQLAANFYNYLLLHTVEGEKALHYLEKRGFSREHIEHYEIGWSLEDPTSLTNLLQRKNFQLSEMERAGLCMMKKDGTGYFDRFRGRIMFPLHDDNGNIVAFSGRVLSTDRDEPKYLNSPESPIFAKNKLLYNFHRARLNVRKKGKVILFEGFMDTIAAERAGILNSVAVMGTSLSETHLLKLKRLTDELIICCDGDEAGWEAARRFALLARQHQLNVRIAVLPNDMDPDEFIQANGGEEFKEKVLDQPFTYFSFIMKYAKRGKNLLHENDVLQYIHEVVEELAQSQSPVERDLLVKQLASETGVSVDAIQEQLIKKIGQRAKEVKRNEMIDRSEPSIMVVPERKSTNVDKAERILLNHLLHDGALFDRLREHYDALFIHDVYNAIFVRLAAFYEQYGTPDFHRFAESIDDRTLRKIVMEAAMLDREPEFAEQEISDCLQCIKEFRIRQQIDQLLQRSKEAEKEKNYSVALELAREIIQLRKSLSAL